MNVEKAKVKAGAVHEVGVRLDDALEAARAEVHRADGASAVLDRAADACAGVFKAIDRDLDEGRISDLETAAAMKKWVERCVNSVRDLRNQSLVTKAQAQGRVSALELAVGIAKKFVDDEHKKIHNFEAAISAGDLAPEEVGRPPPPIKAQRLAADSARRKKG